jgi:hypothetical protein
MGDWDGDGDDTLGFYKHSASMWHLKNDNTPGWSGFTKVIWGGAAGNIPIVGGYVATKWRWFLKDDQVTGWSSVSNFKFGVTVRYEVDAGDWQ